MGAKNYQHIIFLFELKNYNIPVGFHQQVTYEDDWEPIQSIYETLQKACSGKINFKIRSHMSKENGKQAVTNVPEFSQVTIIEDLDEMIELIKKDLETNVYSDLPDNAIARAGNHLAVGIYSNKDVTHNVVANEDVISNYLYNVFWRFGRLMYLDGVRVYDGCTKKEYLKEYDEHLKEWMEQCGPIQISIPTIPYR